MIHDQMERWPVTGREIQARGVVQAFVADAITTPTGETINRQWAAHPGAVCVVAVDEHERMAVVHQYRHPVGWRLVEPPAGLLDVAGEPAIECAKRELAEEAQLQAGSWHVLADVFSSPGGLQENIRFFLARDLSPAPRPKGFTLEGEEVDMGLHWIDVDEVVSMIYQGKVQAISAIIGTLAYAHARDTGRLDSLRTPDTPWDARHHRQEINEA